MAGQAFAEFIRRWERFNNALKPLIPELPHLAADQADFEIMVAEAKDLDNQQKLLRGKLQDTTQQRRNFPGCSFSSSRRGTTPRNGRSRWKRRPAFACTRGTARIAEAGFAS